MNSFACKVLGLSGAALGVGVLFVFAALADLVPAYWGDVVGAYLAVFGVIAGAFIFPWVQQDYC